jgi:hypothetical protein
MKTLNYLLKAFGYCDLHDFSTTVFKLFYLHNLRITIPLIITIGTIREFIEVSVGLNITFIIAFIYLIIAETQTGIKAAIRKKDEKFQSRKFGRMFFKIGVYIGIMYMLNSFAKNTPTGTLIGFEINPFGWLYYIVLVGIVFQMVISYLENLSFLGYAEAKGILGVVLRKYNQWFEFDGTKNADNFNTNNNGSSITGQD